MRETRERDAKVLIGRRLREELKVENRLPDGIMEVLLRLIEAERAGPVPAKPRRKP